VLSFPRMMSTGGDRPSVVRDATEQFLVGDAQALAGELTDALIVVAARVGVLRRTVEAAGREGKRKDGRAGASDPLAGELHAIDEAFGRSVDLARRLSQAIQAHRSPGTYTAVSSLARELGRQLAPALPEKMTLGLRCPPGPVLAVIPSAELRQILVVLVRRVVEGVGESGGELQLEVTASKAPDREARIVVGHEKLRPAAAADAADQARELVHAWGGSVDACARAGGGAAVVVLLPGVC
jgi:hypothetical protein